RRSCLHMPALFRFFRLFRHGHWRSALLRDPFAHEFLFALQGSEHHRILEAVAHHFVALSARLSLYRLGWKPSRKGAAVPQSHDYYASWRVMARRELDVCLLGWT